MKIYIQKSTIICSKLEIQIKSSENNYSQDEDAVITNRMDIIQCKVQC